MKIQKVKHLKDEMSKQKPNLLGEYILTEKIDGIYGYMDYTPDIGWSRVHTSRHRELWSVEHLRRSLVPHMFVFDYNVRLLFELYIPDTPFHTLNGIFNRRREQAEGAVLLCHDLVTPRNPVALTRHDMVTRIVSLADRPELQAAKILNISSDPEVWWKEFSKVTKRGGEGIVLKHKDSIYKPGARDSTLMKMKQSLTLDLEVIGITQTTGKKGELAANLVLKRKSGTLINIVVPKDIDRDNWLVDPTLIVGKVVEVKCMQELQAGGKLREPTLYSIRTDKTVEGLVD